MIDPFPAGAIRWTYQRKRQLVELILADKLSLLDTCSRYGFSVDEIVSLLARYEREGSIAFKAKKLQTYRPRSKTSTQP